MDVEHRLKLEQALVDGTELLSAHVSVVHPSERRVGAEKCETANRIEQILVRNRSTV